MRRTIIAAAVLAMATAPPVLADQLEEGISAYQAGDNARAIHLWRPLAEQGNADAQSWLGRAYERGIGVQKDKVATIMWYRRAAEQGHAFSHLNLGTEYRHGEGVPKDLVLAHMWFNLAASQGDELGARFREDLAETMPADLVAEAWRLAPGVDRSAPAMTDLDLDDMRAVALAYRLERKVRQGDLSVFGAAVAADRERYPDALDRDARNATSHAIAEAVEQGGQWIYGGPPRRA